MSRVDISYTVVNAVLVMLLIAAALACIFARRRTRSGFDVSVRVFCVVCIVYSVLTGFVGLLTFEGFKNFYISLTDKLFVVGSSRTGLPAISLFEAIHRFYYFAPAVFALAAAVLICNIVMFRRPCSAQSAQIFSAEKTTATEKVREETFQDETVEEQIEEERIVQERLTEEEIDEERLTEEQIAEEQIAEEQIAEEQIAEEAVDETSWEANQAQDVLKETTATVDSEVKKWISDDYQEDADFDWRIGGYANPVPELKNDMQADEKETVEKEVIDKEEISKSKDEYVARDGIYIPKLRTVAPTKPAASYFEHYSSLRASVDTVSETPTESKIRKKPAQSKSSAASKSKKAVRSAQNADKQVKPKQTKSSAAPKPKKALEAKTARPEQTVNSKSGKKAATVPPQRNYALPVTRRYVLTERSNVVNMFSLYLKNKSTDDKQRLESSINTIILK